MSALPRALHIGTRFTPAVAARIDRNGNKLERRMLRARAIKQSSSVERRIAAARTAHTDATSMATNSHQPHPPGGSPAATVGG